jgi:hypothetical protein
MKCLISASRGKQSITDVMTHNNAIDTDAVPAWLLPLALSGAGHRER